MSNEIEPRLVAVEKDVEYLRRAAVDQAAVAKLIEPIREEQSKQSTAISQMSHDISSMAQSQKKTSDTLDGVLKTYNDGLIAAAKAETERAKSQSIGAILTKAAVVSGSLVGLSGGVVLIYAIANWVLTHLH
jgi:hypothetical protein